MSGLARALRLDDAERSHLHHLAGTRPPDARGPSHIVRRSIADLLDRLPLAAAIVTSADFQVLEWNDLAAALMEDFSAVPPRERSLLRQVFLHVGPPDRRLYGVSDADEFAAVSAHQLRITAARYPDDPGIADLVRDLLRGSVEFATLWESHDVATLSPLTKTFGHPVVGPITVNCDVLDIAEDDQRVVIYTATPGSPSEESLRLLSVVGTQRMESPR